MVKKHAKKAAAFLLSALLVAATLPAGTLKASAADSGSSFQWGQSNTITQDVALGVQSTTSSATTLIVSGNCNVTIAGNKNTTYKNLTIKIGGGASVTLNVVAIDDGNNNGLSPVDASDGNSGNRLLLGGANKLTAGANAAGVHVAGANALTIGKMYYDDYDTDDTLDAEAGRDGGGGCYGAGIGGSKGEAGGAVTIGGGIISANTGNFTAGAVLYGAGIGGGAGGAEGSVTITGGAVCARGGGSGADIGGTGSAGGANRFEGGSIDADNVNPMPTDGKNPVYKTGISGLPISDDITYQTAGGGYVSAVTNAAGVFYPWLTEGAHTVAVQADGESYAASLTVTKSGPNTAAAAGNGIPFQWGQSNKITQSGTVGLGTQSMASSATTLEINGNYRVTVLGADGAPYQNFTIKIGGGASVTLNGVSVNDMGEDGLSPVDASDGNSGNTLLLHGKNQLSAGANAAGVHVAGTSALTIGKVCSSDSDGAGMLRAAPGGCNDSGKVYYYGAGIGGGKGEAGGTVIINGGYVQTFGRGDGAGIGGGYGSGTGGAGGIVTVNGGIVECQSLFSAGIGGGNSDGTGGAGGSVTVNGGKVFAIGLNGAGIGGGNGGCVGGTAGTVGIGGAGGSVTINGGIVAAQGSGGAGIGGGFGVTPGKGGAGGSVTVSGGAVCVRSINGSRGVSGADIGGGASGTAGNSVVGAGGANVFKGGCIDANKVDAAPTDGNGNIVYQAGISGLPASSGMIANLTYQVDGGRSISSLANAAGRFYPWLTEGKQTVTIQAGSEPYALYAVSLTVTKAGPNTATAAPSTVTGVTVTPSAVTVPAGSTQIFSAAVSGSNYPPQSVTWRVSGNSSTRTAINNSGVLTVGSDETTTALTVTATSAGDSTKSGTATVTVTISPTQPSAPSSPVVPIIAPAPQGTGLGQAFLSDTTAPLSVDDGYTFKITSKDGKVPSFLVGTPGVFDVTLVKQDGNDYYFRLTAIGAPGRSAGIYIDGGARLLVATVGRNANAAACDTTCPFGVESGKSYVFKITAKEKPGFEAGTLGVFRLEFLYQDGDNYYYRITAIGKPGQGCGFYLNGSQQPVSVATIR